MSVSVEELLTEARRRLAAAPFRPERREAALLLAHVLGVGEASVLARGERAVGAPDRRRFARLLDRRLAGEPFAYLVGEREFYGRPFAVDERVLVPRPESEHLIEEALALRASGRLPARPRLLDVGTGSGCLAVTLAVELEAVAVAVDLSPAALAVAAANARRHGVANRVHLLAADLAVALSLSGFDLVISNPPYVEAGEAAELSPEIRDHEPAMALFPPAGGGVFYRRFFAALAGLRAGVPVLAEIGYRQGPMVAALLQETSFDLVAIRPDYAGHDRVVVARRRHR